ncbi:hypothetical protein [Leptospira meyeri]|uniref:Uncharacterized protein n=1 Tax=Leptospira meyeri TaxID=29508 RepID=A0A4R8N008_LEPME|nr:hypothetical protein [Leptospira meyeri]EKJ88018.1 hypothetical protein LEP1GSC017_1819 [Leptospira meyeri serovar Hardjo str. Went 5]EMJ89183.1 hypothetical protein LEP1GSC196_1594 [Leptospira meyeri serovar Semaranga str. Veldrot Semarang 173]TDY73162.1 hypothetical protein CLV96_2184 [Leptospira meyeri]TGL51233.1 hypothetical protein EHQ55_06675 [Leptospira meyeri]TGM64103.1 hypothetical protein EHQ94_15945 [Leptospira meyeri]
MATKKSSSAAKKKAVKKAAKKTNTVKKQSTRNESASLFRNDESAQVSLQSPVSHSEGSSQTKESGNGVYLFLVLAGVLAIGYLGYVKYFKTKAQTPVATASVPADAQTKPVAAEPEKKVEEAPAEESTAGFLVDKVASKKWSEAAAYCKSVGGVVPSKEDLVKFAATAPKEIKSSEEKYWTKTEVDKKSGLAYRFSNGKAPKVDKATSLKVLCKN